MHRPLLEAARTLSSIASLIFGSDDFDEARARLSAWTAEQLGADVAGVEQWHLSVGAVAVVTLTDGRQAALKAFQPRWTFDFLTAVVAVQRHLAEHGLPCAMPIAGPAALRGAGMVCAEEVLPDPGQPSHRLGEAELVASARGLARLVSVAADLPRDRVAALLDHPLRTPVTALYPEPHSPLFDFEATAVGAEWIDDLARAALAARDGDTTDPLVAHTDWSARNVRVWPDGIRAIYDADSLALVPESTAVGIAAATWSAFGDAEDDIAPSAEEAARWLTAYEEAGRSLSPAQRHAAGGSVLYSLTYTARCEHTLEVAHPHHGRPRRARDRLERDGDRYLERFDEACEARR